MILKYVPIQLINLKFDSLHSHWGYTTLFLKMLHFEESKNTLMFSVIIAYFTLVVKYACGIIFADWHYMDISGHQSGPLLFLKKLPDKNVQNMCALDRVAKTVGISVHESTLSDIVFVFLCLTESRHTR